MGAVFVLFMEEGDRSAPESDAAGSMTTSNSSLATTFSRGRTLVQTDRVRFRPLMAVRGDRNGRESVENGEDNRGLR